MKKNIGLTQRVEHVVAYGERRDCLDQAWTDLLWSMSYSPLILPNIRQKHANEYLAELDLHGVILTGGNSLAVTKDSSAAIERDEFESALIDHCLKKNIPVLGVCRGMQMLNHYFGGSSVPISEHVGQPHALNFTDGSHYVVNSYHDWGIMPNTLADGLDIMASHEDGSIECFKHRDFNIQAIMWHPERKQANKPLSKKIISDLFQ